MKGSVLPLIRRSFLALRGRDSLREEVAAALGKEYIHLTSRCFTLAEAKPALLGPQFAGGTSPGIASCLAQSPVLSSKPVATEARLTKDLFPS